MVNTPLALASFEYSIDALSVQHYRYGNLQRPNAVWWLWQSRSGYIHTRAYLWNAFKIDLRWLCTVYVRASYILRSSIMDHSDTAKAVG